MNRHVRWLSLVAFVASTVAGFSSAYAQGVTGAAVTGNITGEGVGPLETATVQLRNTATGEVFSDVSGPGGRYFIDNVPPGGPYTLSVAFTGFPLTSQTGIVVRLGQKLQLDVAMKLSVEEVTIVEHLDVLQDRARSGPTTTVNQDWVQGLPLQGRNFTDLINTSPQAAGGSIGGQNNRYNNIQIDGGRNNDIFGLAASGTPGGQSNARPLSVEAIDQFIIQVAPFDVRQGNFVGGLVNAITKSGTNEFHGSAFAYYQNRELTGNGLHSGDTIFNYNHVTVKDPVSGAVTTPDTINDTQYNSFHVLQYGGSVGGPIIKDKLHFFASFDLQDRSSSFSSPFQISGNPAADMTKAGFTTAEVDRFLSILKDTYGVTGVGDAFAPDINNPDHNVFGKLSWQIDEHNRAELSYNHVDAGVDVLTRNPANISLPNSLGGGYQLSNSGYTISNSTNSIRAKLTSHWGEVSNELLAGVSFIRDHRDIPNQLPLILVNAKAVGTNNQNAWLTAGGDLSSQANILDQDIYQFQDNVTFGLGDKNRITVGTSNELLHFRNVFLQAALGAWAFNSLDDFQNGNAAVFQRRFGVGNVEAGTAKFSVGQIGFYVQDEYQPIKNLTITPGVRVDIPILSSGTNNPDTLGSNFPVDTSKLPTGNPLWSPRLGVNWDVEGNSNTIVRGGVGIFTGEPPYVWLSNAYSVNGLTNVLLSCVAASGVPAFTVNPNQQPTSCTGGTSTLAAPKPIAEVDFFDPDTKYPQSFQAAAGLDRRLPWGLIGSLDFLYSHDVNAWYTTDANLQPVAGGPNAEGRTIYGAFNPATGATTPNRIDATNVQRAIKVFNKGGGEVVSLTAQLTKQIGQWLDVSAAYTYSRSRDIMSLTSSVALSNFQFSPLDGPLEDRNERPSAFDRPHKVTLSGTANLPYGFSAGVSYVGLSGTPYTWVASNDINGDGFANDDVFVPASASQITLRDPNQYAALSEFIDSQECLREAKGSIIQRGACRNPWTSFLNLRLGWGIKVVRDQKISVQFDIFNLLNLLNAEWGTSDGVTTFESPNGFLSSVGYDAANNRPIYNFVRPTVVQSRTISATQTRWRMQLGARYDF